MLQIKTVIDSSAAAFDQEVNAALADGWELVKRYSDDAGFIAELVKETEPEPEQAPVEWEITRDPKLPYRCPHCGYKTDLPMTECPNCEELTSSKDWEGAEA